mmetsp:Transcript_32334/g.67446  ORF Transcript_32334/g.67446 Transcript_32334/m.67446 type:complete len:393 (-) Transcript_32334:2041-3219(-)
MFLGNGKNVVRGMLSSALHRHRQDLVPAPSSSLSSFDTGGGTIKFISSATRPCCFAKKKRSGHPGRKKSKRKNTPRAPRPEPARIFLTDEEKEKAVKEWNEKGRFDTSQDFPMAKVTLPTGPPATMTTEEYELPRTIHFDKLDDLASETLNDPAREQLRLDMLAIETSDGVTWAEEKEQLLNTVMDRRSSESSQTKRLLDVIRQSNYRSSFDKALQNDMVLTQSSKDVAQKVIKSATPSIDPTKTRLWTAKLEVLSSPHKETWISQFNHLMFSRIHDKEQLRLGNSMNHGDEVGVIRGTPLLMLNPNTPDFDVRKGDFVAFVGTCSLGIARYLGKRVAGVAGDIVRDIHGKKVKVPPGHFWALGDNEKDSRDSRHHGAVPISNLRLRVDDSW